MERKPIDPVPLLIRVALLLAALALIVGVLPQTSRFPRTAYGPVLHEETSDFSRIRVRGRDTKRHLLFVTGSGGEQLQSSIDLERPGELQVAYTRALFSSFLVRHPQERVLIVGLGGGGMVRFLAAHFPETKVEVVEIDPAVIRIAAEWFETAEGPRVTIHEEDAFAFFRRDDLPSYDAIYLDAFLRPEADRDPDGSIARMKTSEFLATIREALQPGGVLAVNLVSYRDTTPGDLAALRETFPVVLTMPVPGTGNLAILATDVATDRSQLERRAERLGKSHATGRLPFADFARKLAAEPKPTD